MWQNVNSLFMVVISARMAIIEFLVIIYIFK